MVRMDQREEAGASSPFSLLAPEHDPAVGHVDLRFDDGVQLFLKRAERSRDRQAVFQKCLLLLFGNDQVGNLNAADVICLVPYLDERVRVCLPISPPETASKPSPCSATRRAKGRLRKALEA